LVLITGLARYVWHPALHRQAGEKLFFIRLYFAPVYPDIKEDLVELFKKLDVGSAHVYELIGGSDLMLRLWYAGDILELMRALRLPNLRSSDYMEIRRIHEHWVMPTRSTDAEPDLSALDAPTVEQLNAEIHNPDGPDLSQSVDAGLLSPVPLQEGVKFFVAVTASIGSGDGIKFGDVLFQRISEVLDEAGRLIQGRSVYEGDGFAKLLLMGRFAEEDYFPFMDQVVAKLNDTYLRDVFFARTITALGMRRAPMLGTDLIDPKAVAGHPTQPSPDKDSSRPLEELLAGGENQHLEVQASAFLDFDRFVDEAAPDWSELRPGFVKAICSLLNQRDRKRATLVAGAIETLRYRDWIADRAADLAEVGDFSIWGIDEDNPAGDWELYQSRLTDSLAAVIEPSPVPVMNISLEKHTESGKSLLRIEVTPDGTPFYDERGPVKFWIREGSEIKDLGVPERDVYIAEMKRLKASRA
jgi:hypothetical protein